jgi:hypothetical protein
MIQRQSELSAVTLAVFAFLTSGCVVESGRHYVPADQAPPSYYQTPTSFYIDTGAGIDAVPGDGVGVLVEYVAGGSWHVRTVCDTLRSGQPCNYQIDATALGSTVTAPRGSDSFGPDDAVFASAPDTVAFDATTSTETDGIWFEALPGASVEFRTVLDGADGALLSWRSNGAVVPVDYTIGSTILTPTAP